MAQPVSGERASWVCPYAHAEEASQVIRRRDLVGLGNTFKGVLSPIATLVRTNKEQNVNMSALLYEMQRQSRHIARIQRWMLGIAISATLSIVAHFFALWSLQNIAAHAAESEKAAAKARSSICTQAD